MTDTDQGPKHALDTTQGRQPWRAVIRTTFAAVIGLLPVLPLIAASAHIDTVPAVAAILTATAAVTRILAIPEMEDWLRTFVPWLAADVYPDRKDQPNDQPEEP